MLTSTEVADRVRRGLVNRSPRTDVRDYLHILARNLFTGFNAMVAPAALVLLYLRDFRAAIAVSGMAIANTSLSLMQEVRAKRHLDQLTLLTESKVRARRDGGTTLIASGDIVQDDEIELRAGDTVVADGPVIESRSLEIDEALLTGESDPVRRSVGDPLLSGCVCVAGDGAYRARQVGPESFAHKTSAQARRYSDLSSPLTRSINGIVRLLTAMAIVLCVVHAVGWRVLGLTDDEAIRRIAATITTMVPQGLVLSATIAFIVGAIAMGKKGAVVQRLSAVETMAAVDVVATDKTGTLTTNRLRFEFLHELAPFGAPGGERGEATRLLRMFAAATIDRSNRNIEAIAAHFGGGQAAAIDQIPFKSRNRYSVMRIDEGGRFRLLALGAVEALRSRLTSPLDDDLIVEQQRLGRRLLLFAEGPGDAALGEELPDVKLQPLALIGLGDELRPDAGQVLEALAAQGIQFKVISGDNPETVRGTVAHLNLPIATQPVVTGDEFMASTDRASLAESRGVFGRVAPEQKLAIIETLKQQGHTVAMIGDGVNDVLPIKRADLGIAMGSGSAASKTVSALVLEGDRFDLLPETLEQGRTIVRNLRRGAKLFLTKNVYSLIVILSAYAGLGLPFPYVPQQVTLLNWTVIGIPALAIAASGQRAERVVKNRFLPEVLSFAFRTGVVFGLGGVAILWHACRLHPGDDVVPRTMFLSLLILLGISTLFRALTDGEPERPGGDGAFRLLGLLAVPIYLTAMYLPPARRFFELAPLGLGDWLVVAAYTAFCWAATLLLDRVLTPHR